MIDNEVENDKMEISKELVEILVFIAFSDKGIEEADIASKFGISKPKARYYLDELTDIGYIMYSSIGMGAAWFMEKAGRKYLFENDLL